MCALLFQPMWNKQFYQILCVTINCCIQKERKKRIIHTGLYFCIFYRYWQILELNLYCWSVIFFDRWGPKIIFLTASATSLTTIVRMVCPSLLKEVNCIWFVQLRPASLLADSIFVMLSSPVDSTFSLFFIFKESTTCYLPQAPHPNDTSWYACRVK